MFFNRKNLIFAALLLTACADRDNAGVVDAASQSQIVAPAELQLAFSLGDHLTSCNIETANDQSMDGVDLEVRPGQELTLSGWLVDPESAVPATDWLVVFRTEAGVMFAAPFTENGNRSDLASLFPGIDVSMAGFLLNTRVPAGISGRLSVFLAEPQGDSRRVCGIGRGLVVRAD